MALKRTYAIIGHLTKDESTFDSEGNLIGAGRLTSQVRACSECKALVVNNMAHDRWHASLNDGPVVCILDEDGGVCGLDSCPRCGAPEVPLIDGDR